MDGDRQLVDAYDKLQLQKQDIENQLEQLKAALVVLAKQQNKETLFGTHKVCFIKPYEKVIYPEDKTQFVALVKAKGLYEQFSTLNYLKLGPKIIRGEVDPVIVELTKRATEYRVSLKERGM